MSEPWKRKEVIGDCTLYLGDCISVMKALPELSVNCCVTSPPYFGLRDYGVNGQIGLEPTIDEYVSKLIDVFREVKRVLRHDGTLWLNLGDSYSNAGTRQGDAGGGLSDSINKHRKIGSGYRPRVDGLKNKDLIGIPWTVAFALRADGWFLRQDIIWSKPSVIPEGRVTDRCTKSHEYIFLLSKSPQYYFDNDAIAENVSDVAYVEKNGDEYFPKKSRRSVWNVSTTSCSGAHFAAFPPKLIEPCVLAGCPGDGTVIDPFNGSGTTGVVSISLGRKYIGIELNESYFTDITCERITNAYRQQKLF